MHSGIHFSVQPAFYIFIALSFFSLPMQWVIGWLVAAGMHEFFHILMMWILKVPIQSIRLCVSGAVIATGTVMPLKEYLCAMAGPVGGLLALLLIKVMPQIALCAAIQSLYNLLPVYPLDGGRAVKCMATHFSGDEKAERISKVLTIIVIIILAGIGIFVSCRYQLGLLPFLFPVLPLLSSVYKNTLQRG